MKLIFSLVFSSSLLCACQTVSNGSSQDQTVEVVGKHERSPASAGNYAIYCYAEPSDQESASILAKIPDAPTRFGVEILRGSVVIATAIAHSPREIEDATALAKQRFYFLGQATGAADTDRVHGKVLGCKTVQLQ